MRLVKLRPLHGDLVVARQLGGETVIEDLTWACNHCNLHKRSNMTGIDPATGQSARLFHPRQDGWEDHFHWQGAVMVGRTVIGRATIRVLDANDPFWSP